MIFPDTHRDTGSCELLLHHLAPAEDTTQAGAKIAFVTFKDKVLLLPQKKTGHRLEEARMWMGHGGKS